MYKTFSFSVLISCLFATALSAQSPDSDPSFKNLALKASYFGEFVLHPGFAVGIDYTLKKRKAFTLHWDTEAGAYFHKWNNNAVFLQSTIGTRFTSRFSAFVDVNAGLGYMLTSPDGDVYSVDKNQELTLEDKPYYSHLKPTLSLLLGWDGSHKNDLPLLIQAGLEAYWQSHFNHILLPHAALRLGVVYKIKKQ